MPGLADRLEPGIGQRLAEFAAIIGRDDAVVFAPDHQSRNPYSVQPLTKSWIVHVGPPAIERGRLAVASNRLRLRVTEHAVIRQCVLRVVKSPTAQFVSGQRINIGDVALFVPAELEADRVDQHESVDPLEAADANFQSYPPAEGGACQRHL